MKKCVMQVFSRAFLLGKFFLKDGFFHKVRDNVFHFFPLYQKFDNTFTFDGDLKLCTLLLNICRFWDIHLYHLHIYAFV